jgi:hypothetical protein
MREIRHNNASGRHLRNLQCKIEATPERPGHILAEGGAGYRLRAPERPFIPVAVRS